MYFFKENFDSIGCFWFDKKLIENYQWAGLPKASKAVYPIICSFMNDNGESFPSEQTISMRAGRTEKIVRDGIEGMNDFPGVKITKYVTQKGRRSKKFFITKPPVEKGRLFPFHKKIIEGGNWSQLKPTAQALYPVMRYFGFFNIDLYCEIENQEYEPSDFDEIYKGRQWDFCEAETSIMAQYAGIDRKSISVALNSLKENFLIEELENYYGWKVYLHPQCSYKISFLNKNAIRRMGKNYRS